MPSDRRIKVICFDLGGVLIRICRSWNQGCLAAGLDTRLPDNSFSILDSWRTLVQQYQTGRIDCGTFALQLSAEMKGAYSPDEVMAVHHAWMCEQYPGVEQLIDDIHAWKDNGGGGLITAALSNTNHAHWIRMPEYPAVMKLHHRFASHELGLHKPEAAIFREFEQRIGAAGPQVLFFDDLRENVETSLSLRWQSHQIDPLDDPASQIRAALREHGINL